MERTKAPLLFLKAGIACAEPYGFYQDVAAHYECEIVSVDEQRLVNASLRGVTPGFSSFETMKARDSALELTEDWLGRGVNVFYDGFLNSFGNRERMRSHATWYGAHVILLAVRNRITDIKLETARRFGEDQLPYPAAITSLASELRIVGLAAGNIEWPRLNERPINLHGADPNIFEKLTVQVDARLQAASLDD